jgi:hypothetical protein
VRSRILWILIAGYYSLYVANSATPSAWASILPGVALSQQQEPTGNEGGTKGAPAPLPRENDQMRRATDSPFTKTPDSHLTKERITLEPASQPKSHAGLRHAGAPALKHTGRPKNLAASHAPARQDQSAAPPASPTKEHPGSEGGGKGKSATTKSAGSGAGSAQKASGKRPGSKGGTAGKTGNKEKPGTEAGSAGRAAAKKESEAPKPKPD